MQGATTNSFTLTMLTDWLWTAQRSLRSARAEIDALNVFPVPDGDTGTNLYLTWEAACSALGVPGDSGPGESLLDQDDYAGTAHRVGRQAILGARGNSGVIMSALLREVCTAVAHNPNGIAQALRAGALGAYSAVAAPVEGTILTVARACAEHAEEVAAQGGDLSDIVVGAADAAYQALLRTPEYLEQLRDAGVVDAGGRGLVVVLDSLVNTVTGNFPRRAPTHPSVTPTRITESGASSVPGDLPEFEVMFLLDAPVVDNLVADLEACGNSVMVAGVDATFTVHVHVDSHNISTALNAGLARGVVSQVSVTPLSHHCQTGPAHPERGNSANTPRVHLHRALVAVVHGPGILDLLTDAGAVCIAMPARQQPSAAELIEAGKAAGSPEVILLPSDRDAHAVAEIAATELRTFGLRASVIPTRSITQTLAAAAVHDPHQEFDSDVVSMTRAASATRYGAVTQATRTVLTMAGECKEGDFLGLIDGEISVIGHNVVEVSTEVLKRMLAPGAELVTIVRGSDGDVGESDRLSQWVIEHNSLVEVTIIDGGQPLWPFIFGVE